MKVLYTKSGKCGNMVWQRNRYGQIYYEAFIPANPRTPAQVAVRGNFTAVSKRWQTLTQEQRDLWNAVARTKKSKPRLGSGRLPGFNFFVKINVALANRGMAQVDLPPEDPRVPQLAVSSLFSTSRFDQPPVGPILFLQANQFIDGWDHAPPASLRPVCRPQPADLRLLHSSFLLLPSPWLPPGPPGLCPFPPADLSFLPFSFCLSCAPAM